MFLFFRVNQPNGGIFTQQLLLEQTCTFLEEEVRLYSLFNVLLTTECTITHPCKPPTCTTQNTKIRNCCQNLLGHSILSYWVVNINLGKCFLIHRDHCFFLLQGTEEGMNTVVKKFIPILSECLTQVCWVCLVPCY